LGGAQGPDGPGQRGWHRDAVRQEVASLSSIGNAGRARGGRKLFPIPQCGQDEAPALQKRNRKTVKYRHTSTESAPMSRPDAATLLAALKDFLAARFDIPAEQSQPDAALRDLGLDSMMVMDVMLETEDRFQVKLTDLALPREPTLRDIVALIERNLGAQA
jgi:acyl carrier protein